MAKTSRKSYTAAQKLHIVDFAEKNGNRQAGRQFNVSEKLVRDWRRDKAQLEAMDKQKLANRGRKCFWPKLEDAVYEWIDDQRKCLIPVSKNMICVKAIEVARDLGEANFSGCASWCDRFMKRKGLSVCRRSHIAQKIPRDYEEQVMAFQRLIVKMRRKNMYELGQIGIMHEVPMCFDMPPNRNVTKTGEKAVQVKTTEHEKSYSTVVLSCCADGTKLLPLVILKRKTLPKERIPADVAVQVHEMGWMEERGMIEWIKIVWDRRPGAVFKKKAMLVMDAFRGHLHASVRSLLKVLKTDVVIIPDGLTGILQPLDVAVNKLFKDRMRQKWVDWLSGDHSFTAQGNLKRPQLATMCEWIKESWEEIPMDLIEQAFLKTSISNQLDVAEDDALLNSGTGTGTDSNSENSVLERVVEQKWSFKPGEKEEPTGVEEVESHSQLSIMGNQFKKELEEDLCDSVHHSASTGAEPMTQPTAVKAEKKAESTPVGDAEELREQHRCGHCDEELSGLEFVVKAEQEEEHVAQRLNQRNTDIKSDDPVYSNATEQCPQSQSIQSPLYHTPATMGVSRSTVPSSEASYAEEFDKMDEKPSVCSDELRSEAIHTQHGQYKKRLVHTVERENQTLLSQQQQHGPSVKHRRGSESPAQPHSGFQYETDCSLNSTAVKAGKRRKTRRRPGFNEKLFSCTQCEKRFNFHSLLKVHQRIHTGEKPYSCTDCGKQFSQMGILLNHQQCHTGEKPFSCAHCGKRFSRHYSFIRHQRVHTIVKPFTCSQCRKCYSYLRSLRAHQRLHCINSPGKSGRAVAL